MKLRVMLSYLRNTMVHYNHIKRVSNLNKCILELSKYEHCAVKKPLEPKQMKSYFHVEDTSPTYIYFERPGWPF